MPVRAKKTCAVPGCQVLTIERWCEAHKKSKHVARPYDVSRGNSAARGYDSTWRKVRLLALSRDHHLCQHCLQRDELVAATEVDHIVPIAAGGERLDLDNLQSLCSTCHKIKTFNEDGALGRQKKQRETNGAASSA
jgi:5-methylcytosine-specific restriction protein A